MDLSSGYPNPQGYVHVRTIISIVLGLSITRLFTGLARFVQHPNRVKIYPVHLAWVLFILLYVVEFWWWEFRLSKLDEWTFPIYLFVIFYAGLFVFLCSLLFPDDLLGYSGLEDYFMSRRKWFFGLLAVTFLLDLVDTQLKGADYFHSLGLQYLIRNLAYVTLAVTAMFVENRRFHAVFVACALLYLVVWIAQRYFVLG
jgi:hypothetical protein